MSEYIKKRYKQKLPVIFAIVIVMGIAKHTAVLCVEVVLRRSLCGAGGEKKCGEQGAEKFFHRVFLISELF